MHLGELAFDAMLFLDLAAVLALGRAVNFATALALFGFLLDIGALGIVGLDLAALGALVTCFHDLSPIRKD